MADALCKPFGPGPSNWSSRTSGITRTQPHHHRGPSASQNPDPHAAQARHLPRGLRSSSRMRARWILRWPEGWELLRRDRFDRATDLALRLPCGGSDGRQSCDSCGSPQRLGRHCLPRRWQAQGLENRQKRRRRSRLSGTCRISPEVCMWGNIATVGKRPA